MLPGPLCSQCGEETGAVRQGSMGSAHTHLWELGQSRCVWMSVIRRGQLLPRPVPSPACVLSLNTTALSTLGIQEKYLASSDQTAEQEAMQL